ncbi:hypothetical protein ElyMa_002020200 [Elysia marginata]|uniref:Uncharacterized protein n=1 Tax=Elysia marginata TaxID=1093978 RepID=A0AAV4F6J3_9GAST|nr:hypothetical protein ElyMa_002020200 [Elysia marginata]
MRLLSEKKGTKEGRQRNESIVKALFFTSEDTRLQLQISSAVLTIFKEYFCLFQTKAPLAHKLHDIHMECVRKFLCCFIKPEHIPTNLRKLTIDSIKDQSTNLPHTHRHVCIGHSNIKATSKLMDQVLQGYVSAAQLMLKKLPTHNSTLWTPTKPTTL